MSDQTRPWERVSLRPLDDIPLESFKAWQNDPVLRDLTMGFPFPVQQTTVAKWLEGKAVASGSTSAAYAIFLDEQGVGACFLDAINWIHRTARFGIYIGDVAARGSGAGFCATCLLLDFAFQGLNLRRIELDVLSTNAAAIALYKSLGFVHEGTARAQRIMRGQEVDCERFGILADEFLVTLPSVAKALAMQKEHRPG